MDFSYTAKPELFIITPDRIVAQSGKKVSTNDVTIEVIVKLQFCNNNSPLKNAVLPDFSPHL
jgi:hypothetical protein